MVSLKFTFSRDNRVHQTEENIKDFIRYWTFPMFRPRRFHAFGVGMPKSGTHSLEAIFEGYRKWHEPRLVRFMNIARRRSEGDLTDTQAREVIRGLDRRMWLELNSSWVNYFLLEILVDEYPQAKFIFTIRDCYSWLDSILNELLGVDHGEYESQFQRWYGDSLTRESHKDGEKVLEEHGFWPLDGWFRFWNEHNTGVLNLVPSDRLLIVRTPEIRQNIPRIADFLDIPVDTLDASRSHEHKAAKKFGLLSRIDEECLSEGVDKHCKDLMERFFPEIRQLSDVRGYREQDTHGQEQPIASDMIE